MPVRIALMNDAMDAQALHACAASLATCRKRLTRRTKPALATRVAKLAIAVLALAVMFYGARWSLLEAPAAASELVIATCMIDAVYGDACGPVEPEHP
jgi:hypothetical protein